MIGQNAHQEQKWGAQMSRQALKTLFATLLLAGSSLSAAAGDGEKTVTVTSGEWELIGDLRMPPNAHDAPVVLMLNKAAGNRHAYQPLAEQLAARGIASLRLDMRGHGDSTNAGRFIPNEATAADRERLIWNSEKDVIAAVEYLRALPNIDAARIGIIGGSYSGEETAEAGRLTSFAQAYVMMSPGSFSAESIAEMDSSGVPWLFITSHDDRHLTQITADVHSKTKLVEILYLPGSGHASTILELRPDMVERIAVWLAAKLNDRPAPGLAPNLSR
jgi:dienelactone hydrolase